MPNSLNAVSRVAGRLHAAAHRRTKEDIHEAVQSKKDAVAERLSTVGNDATFVDLFVQFAHASGLPKMDVVGSADPYFVARIDTRLSFVSSVKTNTLEPVWNESWTIRNVPDTAILLVEVLDRDIGCIRDDYIGQFSTAVTSSEQAFAIEDPSHLKRNRGTFSLQIDAVPSLDPDAGSHPYMFDGPICYSRHSSPTIGKLTKLDKARLYSTWQVFIRGVSRFLDDEVQPWNRNHRAARQIFQGPTSAAVRSMIHSGHRVLYARTATNEFGVLNNAHDVYCLLHGGHVRQQRERRRRSADGPFAHRIKPAVYNYVIAADDDSLRFSETGAAFFVNYASKHALHADCAPSVRYSGEFHPRPAGGWENFSDDVPDEDVQWELVVDNKSGTYSPDGSLLPVVAQLFEFNFPGFKAVPLAYDDPLLAESTKACRTYALSKRGVKHDELQPHVHDGEGEMLSQQTSMLSLDGEENLEVELEVHSEA
ncbi:hypothetical protein SCP_0412790 [Sparassis crispa]|uniref:C2 domain-containing protein n=1 Tax=Sparassis crispa TaxID=139825 RepID=A0A401GL72_9APHY|nr:hypothetical protein SCP_0412790 [Sparassis crispa]GBE82892.1 hypothetical protein SCP_0412790 [Sparassis crispa]